MDVPVHATGDRFILDESRLLLQVRLLLMHGSWQWGSPRPATLVAVAAAAAAALACTTRPVDIGASLIVLDSGRASTPFFFFF